MVSSGDITGVSITLEDNVLFSSPSWGGRVSVALLFGGDDDIVSSPLRGCTSTVEITKGEDIGEFSPLGDVISSLGDSASIVAPLSGGGDVIVSSLTGGGDTKASPGADSSRVLITTVWSSRMS